MESRATRSLWRVLLPLLLLAAGIVLLLLLLPKAPKQLEGGLRAEPLRDRVTASGPRFKKLPSKDTGLVFKNELKKENSFTYLTNGAGMTVGDYDNDGLPDVYLVSQDGPNKLFRQTSPLHFEDVTAKAGNVDGGAAWGTGACFVDIDGDGWLDLYVCNMEAPNKLYRNKGDGTFEECSKRFGLDFCGASVMAAFADFDRDGKLDMYLVTNRALHAGWSLTPEVLKGMQPPAETVRKPIDMVPSAQDLQGPLAQWYFGGKEFVDDGKLPERLREHFHAAYGRVYMAGQPDHLFHNDGGHFTDVTAGAGLKDQGMGLSATWWDYDNDGWPDLYVANDLESPDTLWHNEHNGTFRDVTAEVLPHTAYYGMGSDAGDIDNDGRLDFIVGDMSATTHKQAKILMGDMTRQRQFLISARPPQYMRNALFLNTGSARFQEIAFLAGVASTDWTWSLLFGDLDDDGWQDLFVTNGIARFDMNPDIEAKVRALWQQGKQADAIEQILNVPKHAEKNLALRNEGNLHFQKTGDLWGLDQLVVSHGAVLVDLDRDGDLDIITNNWNEEVSLFQNVGAGHAIEVQLHGQASNRFGLGARVEITTDAGLQMRELWSSRGYLSGQEPRLHFGVGKSPRIITLTVHWPSGHTQEFKDLAIDQRFTITEPPGPGGRFEPRAAAAAPTVFGPLSKAPQFRHKERDFDDYGAQPLLAHKLSQLGPGVAVGDANGDGVDDLFVAGAAGQKSALLVNETSTGGWRLVPGPWEEDSEAECMGALWFDFDGDGDLDLLVVTGGVEAPAGDARQRDHLYRNDGNLHFTRADDLLPDLRESGSSVAAADFDGDGDLDLVIGGRCVPGMFPDAPPTRLLRNDGGRFVDVTAELAPALLTAGMVTSVLFADVDGDGWPDLLVTALWQPVRCLHNDHGRFVDDTAGAGLAACTGWWNSIVGLDVDGDGDIDFVVGNVGRNCKYKATADHPTGLLWNDFDGSGHRNLVETKYEGDNLLPVRGRSCSSQAMPFLAEKFPTYEQFASSLLKDIYPADKLATAGKLEATCLDSVLLRNDGHGRFKIEPLPLLAQAAPIFGMAVADFDGDGRLDVVAGQNFFSPEPETGRMDGGLGLWLKNDGKNLVPTRADVSGLCLFGDHKGVATADLDGDGRPDVIFALNDGPLQCVRSTLGSPGVAVRLQGSKGNPTGIGARITATLADGRSVVREVAAGSGYLSQSSASLLFAGGVSKVTVRWPDGSTNSVDVKAGEKAVTIAHR